MHLDTSPQPLCALLREQDEDGYLWSRSTLGPGTCPRYCLSVFKISQASSPYKLHEGSYLPKISTLAKIAKFVSNYNQKKNFPLQYILGVGGSDSQLPIPISPLEGGEMRVSSGKGLIAVPFLSIETPLKGRYFSIPPCLSASLTAPPLSSQKW